jgi:glycosyltransferase involved in cell wall biosynthesis
MENSQSHTSPRRRFAFIGNSLPRRCGIATFTSDLQQAVASSSGAPETVIVAMTDEGRHYDYPEGVRREIEEQDLNAYTQAAGFLNAGRFDVACLQHEFGIFGGESGSHIMGLLSRLTMPVVTTLHTVLAEPSPVQHQVLSSIADASTTIVVMAAKARELLERTYHVPAEKIEVIAHGIPDCPFVEPDAAKARRGFAGKSVILTFGLLSPNKGIEFMIDAMPGIRQRRDDAVYVVLGATHPNLVRREGEAYRESLKARARALGVEDHVKFLDQFVDQATLIDFISMCDVYVSPYLKEAQMTSGTLAYSFGMGKAVVSTEYWHAKELLADGRGVLIPFADAKAIEAAIAALLTDESRRTAMRQRAYAFSRAMTWPRTAERYVRVFGQANRKHRVKAITLGKAGPTPKERPPLPQMQLGHLLSMCDDTGLLQHAIHSVPDRSHGYCLDDNARALLVALSLNAPGEQPMPQVVTARFAGFIQHAWNAPAGRFRNFMSFDRHWLEEIGSEDSHGRTLWALGECTRRDADLSRRRWAETLFSAAAPAAEQFRSPRAWAFALLGLNARCAAGGAPEAFHALRRELAGRLMRILRAVETPEWTWFEEALAYDNARLPQALIVTGLETNEPACLAAGLRTLSWLVEMQTSESGCFRPVGSLSFGHKRRPPHAFDQQALEANATIAACLAAWTAVADPKWKAEARRAFAWFLGSNDLSISLVDPDSGSCRDGLHPGRANENRGAESAVSYLLGLAEIRQLARPEGQYTRLAPVRSSEI